MGSGVGGGVGSRLGAGRRVGGALRAGGGRRREPESSLAGGSYASGLLSTSFSSSDDCAEICGEDMPELSSEFSRLDGRGGGRLDDEGFGGARLEVEGFGGAARLVAGVSYSDSCSEICSCLGGAGFRGAGFRTGEIGCGRGREGAAPRELFDCCCSEVDENVVDDDVDI